MRKYIDIIGEIQEASAAPLAHPEPKTITITLPRSVAGKAERILKNEFTHMVYYSRSGFMSVTFEIHCYSEEIADQIESLFAELNH